MAWFLSNLRYVAWTALAVGALFLIYFAMGVAGYSFGDAAFWESTLRWLHVLVGIMWIGHLYYFNFTQIPNMPKIPDEQKPAIGKVIAPAALFWFRWGAMATLVTGVLLAMNQGYLLQAYTLGGADDPSFAVPKHILIGIGMWLATIMWFNVWFIIWPNQQKALNIDNKYPNLDAAAKAAAGKTAMLFSRTNTFLSVPMLVAMTGASTLF
ncbi:MAG: urate hydroxylase PuuD [Hyphomonadaceae bacterium]